MIKGWKLDVLSQRTKKWDVLSQKRNQYVHSTEVAHDCIFPNGNARDVTPQSRHTVVRVNFASIMWHTDKSANAIGRDCEEKKNVTILINGDENMFSSEKVDQSPQFWNHKMKYVCWIEQIRDDKIISRSN